MDKEHEAQQAETDDLLNMVLQSNEPTVLEEDVVRALMDLPNRPYTDMEGNRHPYLSANELGALSIRKGSLTDKERREIESHVTHTYRFLSQIPWTGEYKRVPDIAYAHHEKLDGTGYPRRLDGEALDLPMRVLAVADVYEALTADRPYRGPLPVETALEIITKDVPYKLDAEARNALETWLGLTPPGLDGVVVTVREPDPDPAPAPVPPTAPRSVNG